jgi:maltokinase
MDDDRSSAALDLTALPPLEEVLELATAQLAAWMPAQRWFAHRGPAAPEVAVAGWAPLRIAAEHVVVLLVAEIRRSPDEASGALYQVPLVLRRPGTGAPEEGAEVGVLAVPGGPLRVDDATRDPDGRAALVAALISGDGAAGPQLVVSTRRTTAPSVRQASALAPGRAMRTRLLDGEQSNTSLIVEAEGASPLIVKLFRVLQDGENPDVVLPEALTAQGSSRVPAVVGSARLRSGAVRTHGLVAQEFLPGVEDAWRVALRLARTGEDFTGPARELGAALAEVHRDLAAALGTMPADERAVDAVLAQMRARLDRACAEVEQVAAHRDRLAALLDAAEEAPWPPLQRIHGDLHLGQVLASPERGWVLLDFEGEPLRPLAERSLPDSPLRDVAGMLRSLDYVAGAVALEHGVDASAWTAAARRAFLEGWGAGADGSTLETGESRTGVAESGAGAVASGAGAGVHGQAVLAAFEADKAVYEALYESRHRPDWLPIPLGALERISAPVAPEGSPG